MLGHPGVAAAAVQHGHRRQRRRQLVGYFVADACTDAELRVWLDDRLPDYMTPAALLRLDALPLSPNGKLDRKALAAVRPKLRSRRSRTPDVDRDLVLRPGRGAARTGPARRPGRELLPCRRRQHHRNPTGQRFARGRTGHYGTRPALPALPGHWPDRCAGYVQDRRRRGRRGYLLLAAGSRRPAAAISRPRGCTVAAPPLQQGIWFHSAYSGGGRLEDPRPSRPKLCIDLRRRPRSPERLHRCFQAALLRRHRSLRVSFHEDGEKRPVQIVRRDCTLSWRDVWICCRTSRRTGGPREESMRWRGTTACGALALEVSAADARHLAKAGARLPPTAAQPAPCSSATAGRRLFSFAISSPSARLTCTRRALPPPADFRAYGSRQTRICADAASRAKLGGPISTASRSRHWSRRTRVALRPPARRCRSGFLGRGPVRPADGDCTRARPHSRERAAEGLGPDARVAAQSH